MWSAQLLVDLIIGPQLIELDFYQVRIGILGLNNFNAMVSPIKSLHFENATIGISAVPLISVIDISAKNIYTER